MAKKLELKSSAQGLDIDRDSFLPEQGMESSPEVR
jgi:hypothetical protein